MSWKKFLQNIFPCPACDICGQCQPARSWSKTSASASTKISTRQSQRKLTIRFQKRWIFVLPSGCADQILEVHLWRTSIPDNKFFLFPKKSFWALLNPIKARRRGLGTQSRSFSIHKLCGQSRRKKEHFRLLRRETQDLPPPNEKCTFFPRIGFSKHLFKT